jgi:hypothetical protein
VGEIEKYIAKDINSSCLAQFCLQHCDLGLPVIGFFFEAGKPIPNSENGRRIEKIQTRRAI